MKDRTEINPEVREKVKARDSFEGAHCCLYCGSQYRVEIHHFVSRGRGGMGIEQNLISLCFRCHARLHSGEKAIHDFCGEYLQGLYPDVTERDLVYRKP